MNNRNSKQNSDSLQHEVVELYWQVMPPFWHKVRAHIREVVESRFDISVEQYHILRHIAQGVNQVSELAQQKQISLSAVSQAVEVLVMKELITRTVNPLDRRMQILALTKKGEELVACVTQDTQSWMRETLKTLDQTELQTLLLGMRALQKVI
ncbi:MAG: MarR family winged helix-turn-helix transcriptional regulator [Anaerolineales bacterium]